MLETTHNHGLVCQKMRTDTSFLTANLSRSAFAESKTMETFHPDMSTYVKSCTRTRPRKSKLWSHIVVSRFLWSISCLNRCGQSLWSVVFRGQSFFLVVVVSLLRDQSFFVDGVYILWWLCTRSYWDIWLGKTAVNVWTNVRGRVGRTRVRGHEIRPKPKPNVDYYLVTYLLLFFLLYVY